MKYTIEVEDEVDSILRSNSQKSGMSVEKLIAELVKRYLIDAHIMEKAEQWQRGIDDCAEINLDWANL